MQPHSLALLGQTPFYSRFCAWKIKYESACNSPLPPDFACFSVSWVSVTFLYYKSFSHTWAFFASFQLLDWPQMSIWKCHQTMSVLAAHFLQFPCSLWVSCLLAGNRHNKQTWGKENEALAHVLQHHEAKLTCTGWLICAGSGTKVRRT